MDVFNIGNINSTNPLFSDFHSDIKNRSNLYQKPVYDSIEINPKNKKSDDKSSIINKAAIAAAIGAAIAGVFVYKKLNPKFYFDNIKKVQLEQNIKMPEFKSREDAVKFAKEKLQIPVIDDNVPFEALKDVLKSIIDISNKNKGQFYNTNRISMIKPSDATIAQVHAAPAQNSFGRLEISEIFYNNKRLDKKLNDLLSPNNSSSKSNKQNNVDSDDKNYLLKLFSISSSIKKNFSSLINNYRNNPEGMTIKEKQTLYFSLVKYYEQVIIAEKNPIVILKKLDDVYPDLLKKEGMTIDEISKKTKLEQSEYLKKVINNNDNVKVIDIEICSIEESIYHEFGHLQDFMKNQKVLKNPFSHIARYTTKEFFDNPSKEFIKFQQRMKKLKSEDEVKKPEFLTNKYEQNTAREVSSYATQSVGEFIAETYSRLIKGCNLSERVMALYKKYNGPLLAA